MADRRAIRSFVLRQGRLTPGQQKALERNWSSYGLSTADGFLNLVEVYGNNNPVCLEIGFGTGESLAAQAAQQPDINFIGVEVHKPGVGHLLLLAEKQGLQNLRVYSEDSIDVLTLSIPDTSLKRVQVFFPDPWHKKRHHKRRLVNATFADLIASKLQVGGLLHIATDWAPYAEQVMEVLDASPLFEATDPPSRPETKFERRGVKLGHEVMDLAYRLTG